jgi:VanZ family protein
VSVGRGASPGRLRAVRAAAAVYVAFVLAIVLTHEPVPSGPARRAVTAVSPPATDPTVEPMKQVQRVGWRRLDVTVNLLLLVPFGALVTMGWELRPLRVGLLAGAFAASIELLQLTLFTYRDASAWDAALNTGGAALASAAVVFVRSRASGPRQPAD